MLLQGHVHNQETADRLACVLAAGRGCTENQELIFHVSCPQDTAENGPQSTTAKNISVAIVWANEHEISVGNKDCCYFITKYSPTLEQL